jgi:hypothetical protein
VSGWFGHSEPELRCDDYDEIRGTRDRKKRR